MTLQTKLYTVPPDTTLGADDYFIIANKATDIRRINTGTLQDNISVKTIQQTAAPATAAASGTAGELRADANFIYYYTGTAWVRAALATW